MTNKTLGRNDPRGWGSIAQDRIIQAIVAEALRAREDKHFSCEECAEWIEWIGTRLARQWEISHVPGLPEGAQAGFPVWAADGRRFAFTMDRPDGVGLWVGDAETGEVAELPGLSVCDVLGGEPASGGGTVRWSRDGRSLLVLACPQGSQVPARSAPAQSSAGCTMFTSVPLDRSRDFAVSQPTRGCASCAACRAPTCQ